MNVKVNAHNVLVITGIAILGFLAVKLAAKTKAAHIPVLGDALRVGASV